MYELILTPVRAILLFLTLALGSDFANTEPATTDCSCGWEQPNGIGRPVGEMRDYPGWVPNAEFERNRPLPEPFALRLGDAETKLSVLPCQECRKAPQSGLWCRPALWAWATAASSKAICPLIPCTAGRSSPRTGSVAQI